MSAVPVSQKRSAITLAALLAACVVGLSFQARRPTGHTVAETLLLDLSGLGLGIVEGVRDGYRDLEGWFRTRVSLQQENSRLKSELERLSAELWRLRDAEEEKRKVLEKLGGAPPLPSGTQTARLLSLENVGPFHSALLDRGSSSGLRDGCIVLGMNGLVGRVVSTGTTTSRVQLLSDRMAAAGVVLTRSGRTAVARGDGSGRIVVLYVPAIADVVPGEPVVTSGTDGVYPKDIPLGTIEAVRGGGPSIFLDLPVRPYSDPQRESLVFVLPPLPASGAAEAAPVPPSPVKGPDKTRRP